MVGTINLFVTILRNPSSPGVRADVALLDVAVGHFGDMEIVTESEMSFPFVREVASIAYHVVRKAEEGATTAPIMINDTSNLGQMIPTLTSIDYDPLSEVCTSMRFMTLITSTIVTNLSFKLDPFVPEMHQIDDWNFLSATTIDAALSDDLPYSQREW